MSDAIVLLSGCAGDTRRYRAWHAAESLAMAGRRVTVRTVEADPPPADALSGGVTLILHRVAWHPDVEGWIAAVRDGGGRVLYDTDDRVFDDAFAARAAALRAQASGDGTIADLPGSGVGSASPFVPHALAARALAPPADHRRVLEACDGCTAATAPLAEAIATLGRPATVVANAVDLELWRLSEAARRRHAGRRSDGIVLGYASGTATHDADFAACAPAVMAVLDARPETRLRIIGPLALDRAWDRFGHRVERVPFVPWRRLPEAIAAFDVNLAPLDLADPFCLAKSELKWFEAAAVGVPTIAGATPAFREAIRDGDDGFVAADLPAWQTALAALVDDEPRRRAVGAAAREAVRDRYLTDQRAVDWLSALDALGSGPRGAAAPARSTVAAANAAPTPPLVLADDPTLERFAMGAEAVLAERTVSAADAVGAAGPWLAARATAVRLAAGAPVGAVTAAGVIALPYPLDHRAFDRIHDPDGPANRPSNRPMLLCDWGLVRDSSRALALQALAAASETVPRLAVRLFSSDAAATPPDPAAVDRPGWRQLGALDAAARAGLFASGGVLVAPCFGNVPPAVLEAMAAGVAIAAVDVPAVRWLLRDGATAALSAPDGDALGVAAARLLTDSARRERIAATGRDAVARHSTGRHAAALAALARGAAAAPPPWNWHLDAFQPFGADASPPLLTGRSIGLSFVAGHDGLCRIDLRLVAADPPAAAPDDQAVDGAPRWRPLHRAERAALRLEVIPGLPATTIAAMRDTGTSTEARPVGDARDVGDPSDVGPRAVSTGPEPIDTAGDDWVRFTFAPLDASAGRWWTARLSVRAAEPPAVHVMGIAADAFADGHAVMDDAVVTGWSPAFRLWATPPPVASDVLPDPLAPALWGALGLAAAEAAEMERREAVVAALWPMRTARWLARTGEPLPPVDRRPWPTDAPAHVKALGTLRHYGPLALVRELRATWRWRRLDAEARAAARDQNTA